MNKLAYLILGILVERMKQHIKDPKHVARVSSLSDLWKQAESLCVSASFEEMCSALNALVDAELIERHGAYKYSFRVTRVEYPKKTA